jgi:hypothetical protein
MSRVIIVLDFETTGLPRKKDCQVRPIQVGAVAVTESLETLSSYKALLCPDVWAPGYDGRPQEIHGISRAQAELEGASMAEGWFDFAVWLVQTRNDHGDETSPVDFTSWSSRFDNAIMARWRKAALPGSNPLGPWQDCTLGKLTAPAGCLQTMYRTWTKTQVGIPTPRFGSLADGCRQTGVEEEQGAVHDALHDARLALMVAQRITI